MNNFGNVINKIAALILIILMLLPFGCSQKRVKEYKRAFRIMGSSLEIVIFTDDEKLFYKITGESIKRASEIDRIFSNYSADSILAEVNREAGRSPVEVPEEFIRLTQKSVDYSKLTDGAFDITVGNLFELWKASANKGDVPPENEISSALDCTGYNKIEIKDRSIYFRSNCLKMDFGAIGKGYVVDEIVKIIKSNGISSAIVNFGGNIYAVGSPVNDDFWEIGINNPDKSGATLDIIGTKNYGVATSGDYEKYFEIKGNKYSHIITPDTGMPVKNIRSVTVAAETATEADALSTAFSVMGLKKTKKFIKKRTELAVMFIEKKEGSYKIFKSGRFREFERNSR